MNSSYNCGVTPENIDSLSQGQIFVFGSNLAGRHGGGAAKTALKWGAIYGEGEGIQGNTYGLPTKDENFNTLTIGHISYRVERLLLVVKECPHFHFIITKVGCGLAGLNIEQVAPLFKDFLLLSNCSLPIEFIELNTKS